MMKPLLPLLLAFILVSTLAAQADLVTVNFDAPGSGVYGGTNYSGPGADTGGVTTEYWNPMAYEGTTSSDLASDGTTPTGITFTDTTPAYFANASTIPLFSPYFDNNQGSAVTETLNNVSAGTYDLYIYSQNGDFADRGGIFTLAGDSTPQPVSNDGADHSTFIAGVNYTEFTDIKLTSPGTISFSYTANPAVYGEGDLNGVQLVEIAEAPEPSTWAMLLGGACLLLVARVRNLARL